MFVFSIYPDLIRESLKESHILIQNMYILKFWQFLASWFLLKKELLYYYNVERERWEIFAYSFTGLRRIFI